MQGESKIPLRNPSGGQLLLRPSASYNKLLDRVAFRILSSIHEDLHLFCENSQRPKIVDYLHKKAPPKSAINVGCR